MDLNILDKLIEYAIIDVFEDTKLKILGFPYKCKFIKRREQENFYIKDATLNFTMIAKDNKIVHFEFKKEYFYNDIYKFLVYSSFLIYENKDDFELILVYPRKARKIVKSMAFTSLRFVYTDVYLDCFNGDKLLMKLAAKASKNRRFKDEEYLALSLIPYMYSKRERITLIIEGLRLANSLNSKKKHSIIIIILILSEGFLDESDMLKLKKEIKMYKIGKMLLEEGKKKAADEVEREISGKMVEKGKNQAKVEIAIDMMRNKEPLDKIMKYTGFDKRTLEKIYYNFK
ncbi:hypothetical protein [Candidatus Arthromitus sp. SFB-turkey]|uniref:hypothetical protein n=1 Tax=Candidatus Arthromitus sp. SFB-turkey TaxID=1840217 RepID=UPI0009EDAE42|nr:hypothetical protein [Candidatus Arthromitus sp. SFB-turkey]HJC99571.1 hypothetical protein [Candidatus Dwaynia gallinarum]